VPEPVPARRPRSATAATRPRSPRPPSASARRSRSTSPAARLWRAGGLLPAERPTPLLSCDRAGAGPMTTFSFLCSIGTITRSVPPRSSRRNAVIGPTAARSRNLRCAPVSRGPVQSFNFRGRRGGFAAPGAVSPGLCCGPRHAAIWRSQAIAISRRLAALATRPYATAPRRPWAPRTPRHFPPRRNPAVVATQGVNSTADAPQSASNAIYHSYLSARHGGRKAW